MNRREIRELRNRRKKAALLMVGGWASFAGGLATIGAAFVSVEYGFGSITSALGITLGIALVAAGMWAVSEALA